jgi:ADP-ribose pyrophosphatase YjhB (NUDIX family)
MAGVVDRGSGESIHDAVVRAARERAELDELGSARLPVVDQLAAE